MVQKICLRKGYAMQVYVYKVHLAAWHPNFRISLFA